MDNVNDVIDSETMALFGGLASSIETNNDEREVQLALRTVRDCLLEAAEIENVGVNQIAKRLGISPSSVSRFFSGEGDIRISTAVVYARALGCLWNFSLYPNSACAVRGNHSGKPELSIYDPKIPQNGGYSTPQVCVTNVMSLATILPSPYDNKMSLKATA